MLTPPDGLTLDVLRSTLSEEWGVTASSMVYRPVGFGSHHWEITDAGGTRWFLIVDELHKKRHALDEPLDVAFSRLRASLAAARGLRDHGHRFVVAPRLTRTGAPAVRTNHRFGVALYPFINGQSFSWGDFSSPEHRQAILDLIVAIHSTPREAYQGAMADDFTIPHRDELAASLAGDVADTGPYAQTDVDPPRGERRRGPATAWSVRRTRRGEP